ncbi:helix-turn-helix domain-containing protein [Jatrophihabitans endophyticus]
MGSENYLAERITTEREARNWSQSELAREMERAGCRIPQTAISKIEKPQRGGRRDISVDEAIGFARVFGIPLGELLLPIEATNDLEVAKDLAAGPTALVARDTAVDTYDQLVGRLRLLYATDQGWKVALEAELGRAVDAANTDDDAMVIARLQFLRDVVLIKPKRAQR